MQARFEDESDDLEWSLKDPDKMTIDKEVQLLISSCLL